MLSFPLAPDVGARLLLRAVALRTAGGPGSGNFGHVGRPGEIGGSGSIGAAITALPPHPSEVLATRWQNFEARVNPLHVDGPSTRSPAWTDMKAEVEPAYWDAGTSATPVTVDIDDLSTYQTFVSGTRLRALEGKVDYTQPVGVVLDYGGKTWLVDGNHRTSLAKLSGRKQVIVWRVDPKVPRVAAAPEFKDFETSVVPEWLNEIPLRAAARRPESAVHTAADAHVAKLSVALRYAFAMGRRAIKPLLASMRAAEFDPDQPRDEQGQWTIGGADHGGSGNGSPDAFKLTDDHANAIASHITGPEVNYALRGEREFTDELREHLKLIDEAITAQPTVPKDVELYRVITKTDFEHLIANPERVNAGYMSVSKSLDAAERGMAETELENDTWVLLKVETDGSVKGFDVNESEEFGPFNSFDTQEEVIFERDLKVSITGKEAPYISKGFFGDGPEVSIPVVRIRVSNGAVKALGSPDQPRDEQGQWTSGGFTREDNKQSYLSITHGATKAEIAVQVHADRLVLDRVSVPEAAQRAGLGTKLVNQMRERAKTEGKLLETSGKATEEGKHLFESFVRRGEAEKVRELISKERKVGWRTVPARYKTYYKFRTSEARSASLSSDLASRAADAVASALDAVLLPTLLRVIAAGGEAGVALLLKQLRAAEFNEDQPRDELGRWSPGGGTAFHGTTEAKLASIFKHGIQPSDTFGGRDGKAWVTSSFREAAGYAERTGSGRPAKRPVILEVRVPRESVAEFKKEWTSSGRAAGVTRETTRTSRNTIQASWIKNARTPDGTVLRTAEVVDDGETFYLVVDIDIDEDLRAASHKHATTQVNLPPDLATRFQSFPIDEDDLAVGCGSRDGRETTPHITVKYGLVDASPDDVRDALAGEPPFTVTLGKVATFEGVEDGTADAVFVEVESLDLVRLNKKIAAAVETADTHPVYKPHANIAYVKPGLGKKYAGDESFAGITATFDRVVFSGVDDEVHEVALRTAEFNPDQPRDEQGQWTSGGATTAVMSAHAESYVSIEGLVHRTSKKAGTLIRTEGFRVTPGPYGEGVHFSPDKAGLYKTHGGEKIAVTLTGVKDIFRVQDHESGQFAIEHHALIRKRFQAIVVGHRGKESEIVVFDPKHIQIGRRRVAEEWRAAAGPLKMRFDVTNSAVVAWAKRHAADLVTQITDTTRDRVRLAVEELQEDGDVDFAHDRILAAVGDEDRATLIARHETMVASHEGQRQSWDQAIDAGLLTGDERVTWIVTDDEKLCPVCEELDGKFRDLDGEYPGGYDGPPAHIQCRCTEGII